MPFQPSRCRFRLWIALLAISDTVPALPLIPAFAGLASLVRDNS
jgi:hypothetical protein